MSSAAVVIGALSVKLGYFCTIPKGNAWNRTLLSLLSYEGRVYVRIVVDLMKTMKVNAYILYIYSNKKETSDFHGTVSFDPVKMSQQK